jgi:hypothetical protein
MVNLDTFLWLAGDAVTALAVALLVSRRAFRTLPIFSCYLVWGLLSDAGQFTVMRYYPASDYNFYLINLIVDSLFQFGVLVELSWSVLRPARAILPKWALPALAGVIALIGAAVWPFTTGPGVGAFSLAGRVQVHVQETFSILRVMFFLALAGGSQVLSIGWRDRELQIATGLGFFSLVSLGVWMHHTGQAVGPQYHRLDQLVAVSYVCSLVYWVGCFATKEAKRREFTPQMQNLLLAVAGNARSARAALDDSKPPRKRDGKE